MIIYQEAANFLKLHIEQGTSLKSLVFNSTSSRKKIIFALLSSALSHIDIIKKVLDKAMILAHEKKLDSYVAILLTYDLLFGKKGIRCKDGPLKDSIMRHKTRLKAEFEMLKIRSKVSCVEDLLDKDIVSNMEAFKIVPKYVRVNLLKTTIEKVCEYFRSHGYTESLGINNDNNIHTMTGKVFWKDKHVFDLLVFPPRTDFHSNPLYLSGEIIIQDKASCFPAHALQVAENVDVIDCCAAPGNKTSHLASLMNNTGKIYAFDKDKDRFNILRNQCEKYGCQNITFTRSNFLQVDPTDKKYEKVQLVLADPSCSGSGIHARKNSVGKDGDDDRKGKLSEFQTSVILHAMKFPNVKRIVYSTCSIYREENEDVVMKVLDLVGNDWTTFKVLPEWHSRGIKEDGISEGVSNDCVRSGLENLTIGFFIGGFKRIKKN